MALQLAVENEQGVSGNYWKIDTVKFNFSPIDSVVIKVNQFLDAAASAALKTPLKTLEYSLTTETPDDFTGVFDAATLDTVSYNPQERAYVYLKTLPEFSGATDV